jgi:hypothetical protein
MRSKVKFREKHESQARKEPCRHYWVIEIANGPVSRGVCKYCGVTKEFLNAFPEYNPLKKNTNPLGLPELTGIKIDENRKS